MTVQEFGILATLLLTIIGWGVTYYYQKRILERQMQFGRALEIKKLVAPRIFKQTDEIIQWLNEGQSLARNYLYVSGKSHGFKDSITEFKELIPGLPQSELPSDIQTKLEKESSKIINKFNEELHSIKDRYVSWTEKHGLVMTQYGQLAFGVGAEKLAVDSTRVFSDYMDAVSKIIFDEVTNQSTDDAIEQMGECYMILLDSVLLLTDKAIKAD
ncbi:hypothetical protein [Candidatus Leptofilum sp.]|uniref:hypothetical protein n=1 Tax=Candidatus Leptofilum sp. TaxID=3241576 RepID=UPI003B5AB34B